MSNFPSRKLEKIVVRSPSGMRVRFANEAQANNRSVNAEIVARLQQTLLPPLSGRLQGLIDHANRARVLTLTPSLVAEMIGEPRMDAVEAAFAGDGSLTSLQLDAIAILCAAQPEWLKHGAGTMFTDSSLPGDRQALINAARNDYANDDIQIDDNAEISQADEGAWVAAWVWISYHHTS